MSLFYNTQIPGEMWIRDLKDNVSPASNVLSAVFLKYKNINSNFYSELTSNNIMKFDVFYDTFFIETHTGYIFEKFYIEDMEVKPYNQINLFNYKKTTSVDYWFDENKNKIYYTQIYCTKDISEEDFFNIVSIDETDLYTINNEDIIDIFSSEESNTNYFNFVLIFKVFDCNTGLSKLLLLDEIKLKYTDKIDWNYDNFYIENPKITYNSDTKNFNISFINRNSKYSFGLISINILNSDMPYITEVNGFLPFLKIDSLNSFISSVNLKYNV